MRASPASSNALTLALAAVGALSACDARTSAPMTPPLAVAIAPLSLSGVSDACYGLVVTHGGETVWEPPRAVREPLWRWSRRRELRRHL